jgi:hypothetical protein
MPIHQPAPPAAAHAAFVSGLPSFLTSNGEYGRPKFVGVPPKLPTLADAGSGSAAAVGMFVLGLSDAARNTARISPERAGWQFYSDGSEPVAGIVTLNPETRSWKMLNIYYGPQVQPQLAVLNRLSELAELNDSSFEVRLLKIPGVNVTVFWLVAQEQGQGDYFVQYPAGNLKVSPGRQDLRPIQAAAFLNAIRPLAAGNLKMPAGYGA